MNEDLLERSRARTSGGELSFIDYGEGPALVLLHGFPTSSVIWHEFIPILGMSMRVIAPDLLGYGESDKPAGVDLSLSAQTRYIRELLATQGIEEFAVCGHELGGGIAQLLAVSGTVHTIALIDSIAFDPGPSPEVDTPVGFVDAWLEEAIAHRERITDEIRAELNAPFAGVGGAEALRRAAGALGVGGLPDESALAAIEAPTLLLWGEDDPFIPVAVAERLNETKIGRASCRERVYVLV